MDFQFSSSKLFSRVDLSIAKILEKAVEGDEVSIEDGTKLFESDGAGFLALTLVADYLRSLSVGNLVTYVVNRNINFTNVCIKRCGFCAFSRDHREEEGYFLPIEEVVRRCKEAWDYGATEVCIQAGLPPRMQGDLYIKICQAIKQELPDIHIHGFSPEEVLYGAVRSNCSPKEYLVQLKSAGVGSLPGTSAEILDQDLRDKISPGRITVDQWVEIITAAHSLGISTTATVMFGHVESYEHISRHIGLIRDIQRFTGGFTEFVPLSFISSEAPMYRNGSIKGIKSGPTGMDVVKVHAIARIMLHKYINNIQASWVKEGSKVSQILLNAGVNDLGGTLINESISTSAGATHGQLMKPNELQNLIVNSGKIPAERYTTYQIKKFYDDEESTGPLDKIDVNPEEIFGSYSQLTSEDKFKFVHPNR